MTDADQEHELEAPAPVEPPAIRTCDLTLALAIIEKERRICAGEPFEDIMSQDRVIRSAIAVAARRRGIDVT